MPFSLSNAPGTFCRALGLVLRGLSWESVISFLGLINFYREHLDLFADTAACLYRLTGAKVKFDWGKEEGSFQKSK